MKLAKHILRLFISPFALGVLITFAMTYLSVFYYSHRSLIGKNDHSLIGIINQIHEKTIDWRLTVRGAQSGSDQVAILAIDDASVEKEGRWPWPRDKQAQLVSRALEYGAKSVSFDIVYSEADQSSSIPTLMRLRRNLGSRVELGADLTSEASTKVKATVAEMIESEIKQTDSDKFLAEAIRKKPDQFIMGAYYETREAALPYQDFCFDALFDRTQESRYWKKEASPLTIVDRPLELIEFPTAMRENLTQYFTQLEALQARAWFEEHSAMIPKITETLEDFAEVLPPETYPGFATLWLNHDVETTKELLRQNKADLATDDGVQLLMRRFGVAFSAKEAADLGIYVRKAGNTYCEHFLSDQDELLNLSQFQKLWGTSKETADAFAEQSWATVWQQIQNQRQPAADKDAKQTTEQDSLEATLARLKSQSIPNAIPELDRWWVSHPLIGDPTKHTGYFNAQLDSDGTVRKSLLLVRAANSYMPSLAFKTFLVDNGYTAVAKIDADSAKPTDPKNDQIYTPGTTKSLKSIEIKDADGKIVMTIPTDPEGYLTINYAGGPRMFAHISAADILSDSDELSIEQQVHDPKTNRWAVQGKRVNKREFLKDKMLIFGATAVGIYDLRVTPFDENYPGVETHANVLSNLLVEKARALGQRTPAGQPGFLRVSPYEPRIMWIVLVVMGLLLSSLLSYYGSIQGLGITACFMGGAYLVDRIWLFGTGIITTSLFPIAEIAMTFVTLTFYKYFTEERTKRALKGTFEKYVSPAIVAEILSDPSNIELGGKKMELTVMFSDVRGFTTISEKLDPRQLSNLLNSYLTPMTDLVFKNKGTLDKYMGDAIMAFWGAPIHFDDHAQHACRCALQMIAKLKELQAEYRAKGLPEIDIGIGLNTGDMSVGNMGSETIRSYTVMGDSVNLGSRLEGINKEYGTRIIISEFTYEAVKNNFVTREADWVRVKGKAQPVRIFELLAENPLSSELSELLKHFNSGFHLYHERQFARAIESFKLALQVQAEDPVSVLYIERCEDYLVDPPDENWDGVHNMKTK